MDALTGGHNVDLCNAICSVIRISQKGADSMPKRGKFFELLDIVRFARPHVLSMDATRTASHLQDRLGGKSFMSYGQIWSRLGDIVRGSLAAKHLESAFASYGADWKNKSIQDCALLLIGVMGGKGNWYPVKSAAKFVLGVAFRPSIKGFWFYEGQSYAVAVNARKGQPLSGDGVKFLARGIHELYCRDDPNNPLPMIVDLSELESGRGRNVRVFVITETESTELSQFEHSLSQFFSSLKIAGIAVPEAPTEGIVDLFRR